MKEKKDSDVGLVFLIMLMVGLVLAVMGLVFCVIKLKEEKAKNNELTAKQNNNTKSVVYIPEEEDELEEEIIEVEDNTEEVVKEEQQNFSDEEIKEAFQNYLNLIDISEPIEIVYNLMGKENVVVDIDSYNDNYLKTNIEYNSFKEAMQEYMSEKEFLNISYFKETNNILYVANAGGIRSNWKIDVIEKTEDSYIGHTTWYSGGTDEYLNEDFEFTIVSYNGKCVIDSCIHK